jgi:hypothetical protein
LIEATPSTLTNKKPSSTRKELQLKINVTWSIDNVLGNATLTYVVENFIPIVAAEVIVISLFFFCAIQSIASTIVDLHHFM